MPKVSDLAKDLGYKAKELVLMVNKHNIGVQIANERADIDARTAASIRAKLPHRRDLKGAMVDEYHKIVEELAAAAPPPKPKKEKVPAAEKPEKVDKKPKAGTPVAAPAAPVHAGAVHAGKVDVAHATKAEKEKRAKEVVLVSTRDVAGQTKAPAHPHVKVGLSADEKAAIRIEVEKPLIDVDKVIGQEHEVRIQHTAEAKAIESGAVNVGVDKEHRAAAHRPKQAPAPPPSRGPVSSAMSRARRPMPYQRPPLRPPVLGPPRAKPVVVPIDQRKFEITVPIRIKDFSAQIGVKTNLIQKKLMEHGIIAPLTASLGEEQVVRLAVEFRRDIVVRKQAVAEDVATATAAEVDNPKDLVQRAPVVVFMGHVDHGKTSLLDRIRGTKVAAGESGGITQHIGASKVVTPDGKSVVFLDTPGHEAFTKMRARGANVTDVAVIVVDAADGVMPQTVEAINHAKAAGVKIMVALNKIDKPQANVNKVKGELAANGLQAEDWGGDTVCAEVSAITGQGVDHLLEMLALEAELLDLKANPKRKASGAVLEARKTDDRGVIATVLVENGTLRKGDIIIAGKAYGRIRAMHDAHGKNLHDAGPSTPAEIQGFVDVPDAGDKFIIIDSIDVARSIAEERQHTAHEASLTERQHVTMEGLFKQIESGKLKEVRVVLKVDVKGSQEVLIQSLAELKHAEVKLRVLHTAIGDINESDVLLADASDAIIIGFHVETEDKAGQVAKDKGVEIRSYTVIYQAIEEMKAALEGLLEPELVEEKMGHATVKEVFRISRVGAIAGSIVTDGKFERNCEIRIIRNGKVIHTGRLEGLKRFKDDVKEVVEGYECGLKVAGRDDIQPGDVIEAFRMQKVARKLTK